MRRSTAGFRSLFASSIVAAATLTGIAVTAAPAVAATTHDDVVYAFGSASFHGSTSGLNLARPVVAMADTANGQRYWLVTEDGAVYSYNAPFYGSITAFHVQHPVVGMTATPSGHGYWIVTDDGTVFPMGDAKWYGSMTHAHLNAKIRSLIPGPGGKGYWLYASDGGVFGFG